MPNVSELSETAATRVSLEFLRQISSTGYLRNRIATDLDIAGNGGHQGRAAPDFGPWQCL